MNNSTTNWPSIDFHERLPNVANVVGTLYANSIVLHTFSFKFCNFAKMQAFLFVAGGETCQRIRGTPLRLAQAYILVNARG